jgi:hypothetical protein
MGNSNNRWLRVLIVRIQMQTVCEVIADSPRDTCFWHND